MSSFDTEITVMSASVAAPTQEAIDAGITPHIEVTLNVGLALPFMNPQTQQPLVVAVGKYRFTLDRNQAIEVFGNALKAAQDLPEHIETSGKLMVASDMSAVTAAAESIRRASGRS